MDGILVVDKPAGPTSHDVVAVARRALATRRIGHTGTLDPLATGVLALVIGQATRLSRFMTGDTKGYDAVVRLGMETDTADREGQAVGGTGERAADVPDTAIHSALERFRGSLVQLPPPFSAKKIGGVRAYALARTGREVPERPVDVTVHRLDLVARDGTRLTLRLETSSGFYVRSLARDLGAQLGCGAHLESLRRYRSGAFTVDQAVDLAALVADPVTAVTRLVPLERLLTNFPAVLLSDEDTRRARHGNPVRAGAAGEARNASGAPSEAFVRLFGPDRRLLAIAREAPGAVLQPVVVLN
jgi:tRNA pseudouridine55 synthase